MENYKNASVVMAGIACLITSCQIPVHYALSGLSIAEYNAAWPWIRPFMSMSTPILFAWIGILLRKKYSSPGIWVKTLLLLLIPASYLFWTVLHSRGIILFANGERCMWFYCAIIGYLIPVESLEKHSSEDGWMDLALFLASAFLYWGVCRVVNHFSVANFQMLDSPWIRLFHRAMRFVPLAMAVFFSGRVLVFPCRTIDGQHKGHSSGGKVPCGTEFIDYSAMVLTVETLWSEDVYSG